MTYRKAFLKEHAVAAAKVKDITLEQAINIIIKRESTKRAFQTLRCYLRPGEFSALTEVHVQHVDNSIEVISKPGAMYQWIIDHGLQHYHQADGTPSTQSTAGSTGICDSWLQGETPPHIPGAQALVAKLRCIMHPQSLPKKICTPGGAFSSRVPPRL
jgi:hypothetical protein